MKSVYEKPVFVEQTVGYVNKFQSSYNEKKATEIDGVSVEKIVREYGSPAFVFSEKTLRQTARQYMRAFKTHYPKITFAWSYKTNYLGAICSALHSEGFIAEVVSHFEYEKARAVGMPGENIIYNGPNKSVESLERAAREGALINVDNYDEIYRLEEVAAKLNRRINVGIRLNLDCGIQPVWSRFGFNYESVQAFNAAKRIQTGGKLNLVGLHCHIGTFILTPSAYGAMIHKLCDFSQILKHELKVDIEYLDIGGGFPSRNKLKGIYYPPELSIPSVEEYAQIVGETLLSRFEPGKLPTVYVESGRAIVDEAGSLITSVTAAKRFPNGRKMYVLDAGVNFLYTSTWYDIPIRVGVDIEGQAEDAVLYGPLCMNIDVVRDSVKLPALSVGTPLVMNPVGAYCVTQWMQFIEYRPNVLMIGENGAIDVIRRRETLQDVIANESIPERLKFDR